MRNGMIVCLALVLFTLLGCGDSIETKLQKAQLAIDNGHPDQAVEFADEVLAEQPDHHAALELKARAQLHLVGGLEGADDTIAKLVQTDPENPGYRRLRLEWCQRSLMELIKAPGVEKDDAAQKRIDDLIARGMEQAEWMLEREGEKADGHYQRAYLKLLDARRTAEVIKSRELLLRQLSGIELSEAQKALDRKREHQESQTDRAKQDLKEAIDKDPQHMMAIRRLVGVFEQREEWTELWTFVQDLRRRESVSVVVASGVSGALLNMPEQQVERDEAFAAIRDLLEKVDEKGRDTDMWRKAMAQVMIADKQLEEAEALLRKVVSGPGGRDRLARYMLAQSLYLQNRFREAKKIIDQYPPRGPSEYILQGHVLMKLGQDNRAQAAFRQAAKSGAPEARNQLLLSMFSGGDLEAARNDVEAFYNENPALVEAILFKLRYERAQNNTGEVKRVLENVSKLNPLKPEHLQVLVDGYLKLGDATTAQSYASRLVDAAPSDVRNHVLRAKTLFALGDVKGSLDLLKELPKRFPDSDEPEVTIAQFYMEYRQLDHAIELLEGVLRRTPDDQEARLSLASGYMQLGMLEDASRMIDKLIEQDPHNDAAHALAVEIAQLSNDHEAIKEHMAMIDERSEVLLKNPSLRARLRLLDGDVEGALSTLHQAIGLGSNDTGIRVMLAKIYADQGKTSEANDQYAKMLQSSPKDMNAYSRFVSYFATNRASGGPRRGLTILQNLDGLDPFLTARTEALLLIAAGQYVEARSKLERLLPLLLQRSDRQALSVADTMARVHLIDKDIEGAIKVYEPLVQANAWPREVQMRLIELKARREGVTEADTAADLAALAQSLTRDEKLVRQRVLNRLMQLRRADLVLEVADKALAATPDDTTMKGIKAQALMALNRADEAVPIWESLVAANPGGVLSRLGLAQTHLARFDYPAAERALRELVEVGPASRLVALTELGNLYVALGLKEQALAAFGELESVAKPRDPRVLYLMGKSYYELDRLTEARDRLARVPAYAPTYASAQVLLARMDQESGDLDAAEKRLTDLSRQPEHRATAATELLALQAFGERFDDLVRSLDQVLRADSLPPVVQVRWLMTRARVADRMRDWEKAEDVLSKASRLFREDKDRVRLDAARVVLLLQQERFARAREVYLRNEALAGSDYGPMLSSLVEPDKPLKLDDKPRGFFGFLVALRAQDLEAAKYAAEGMPNMRSVFRSDLEAYLARPEARGDNARRFAGAVGMAAIALDAGLPTLAEGVATTVANADPANIAAYSVWLQARLDRNASVMPVVTVTRRSLSDSSLALYTSALVKIVDDDFAGAVEAADKLLQREPGHNLLAYKRTQWLQQAGQYDRAIELLDQIANDDGPFRETARNDLSYLLCEHRPDELDRAAKLAEDALKKNPNVAAFMDTLGWIRVKQGKLEEGLELLSRGIKGLSARPAAHYHIGIAYRDAGNPDWARHHLIEAASGQEDPEDVKRAKQALEKLKGDDA